MKDKTFRFNQHACCTNPDKEQIWKGDKISVLFKYAPVGNGWIYGYVFCIEGLTEGCGLRAKCVSLGNITDTIVECKIDVLKKAIDFFEESHRPKTSAKAIKHLKSELTKLIN